MITSVIRLRFWRKIRVDAHCRQVVVISRLPEKQPGPSAEVSVDCSCWVGREAERLVTEPQLIAVHADVNVAVLVFEREA